MTANPQPAVRVDAREAIAALTPAPTEAGGVREPTKAVIAALAAAISLLERTPRAKKAAPSDRMFDQMLTDYRKALEDGRAALSSTPAADAGWDRDAAFIKWWCAQPRDDAFQQKDWFAQRAFNAGIETALNPEARDER